MKEFLRKYIDKKVMVKFSTLDLNDELVKYDKFTNGILNAIILSEDNNLNNFTIDVYIDNRQVINYYIEDSILKDITKRIKKILDK